MHRLLSISIIIALYYVLATRGAAIKYDQRQEGEVNVRADLENFVVLLIPTSSSSGLSLLDLITKAAIPAKKANKKKYQKHETALDTEDEELQHFIESKSAAPYRVDLTQKLAKLRPTQAPIVEEEILISPTVQLDRVKKAIIEVPEGEISFEAKPIPLTPQQGGEEELVLLEQAPKVKRVSGDELLLLGALEQCGPGRRRDHLGVCQFIVDP